MHVAYSPCPNDTFIFHAWKEKLIPTSIEMRETLGDIQTLNQWAKEGRYPLIKVSFHCLVNLLDEYLLLPVGAALGYGCGPKIIARTPFALDELSSKRVAIPGRDTTAHLLLDLLCPPPLEKVFCRYEEIGALIDKGVVDAGLIIHETRFTFASAGFLEIADLGILWENRFSLPLPLGGLAAKRSLGEERLDEITKTLQRSLSFAWQNKKQILPALLETSQEKELAIIEKHIDLYVTQESYALSEKGRKGIETLVNLSTALTHSQQSKHPSPLTYSDLLPKV